MAKAYYSVALDHTADEMWTFIRSFGDYAWSGVDGVTVIEDGKSGDQVGAVRRVQVGDKVIRQRLLAHSDVDRSYTYAYLEPAPVRNYQATICVVPLVESDTAFVQWWAIFDCDEAACERWTHFFAFEGFARWLAALRSAMADRPN